MRFQTVYRINDNNAKIQTTDKVKYGLCATIHFVLHFNHKCQRLHVIFLPRVCEKSFMLR